MRVIICGDTHIGAILGLGKPNGRGGNTRIDDYEASLNHIINYTINTGADVFIQTGDVFDVRNPEVEHIAVVNRAIRRLSNAGVTSIWLMGNHDYKRSGNAYTSAITSLSAGDYPNTRVVLAPQVVEFSNGRGERASIVLIPFRDRRMYLGNSTEEDSLMYKLEVEALIDNCEQSTPIIAVGHNFFLEGSYGHYGGSEVMADINAFSKCDIVAMGHYHTFKIMNRNNPIAFYPGSMEKLNFGDEKVDKYFIDYDVNRKKVAVKNIPSRQLMDCYINLEDVDFNDLYIKVGEAAGRLEVKDAIVRVRIAIKDNFASSVKKSDIQNILYDNGAFYVSKILLDPIHQRLNRDLEILDEKTDLGMFKAFLKKQDITDEMRKSISKEAEKMMK